MTELPQLMLAKRFLAEADRHLDQKNDFAHGQAVSSAQDCVELLLRSAARHNQAPLKDKAGLKEIIAGLDQHASEHSMPKVPHRVRIEELNTARVSFKHFGLAPTGADAARLVRYGLDFAEVACLQYFGRERSSLAMSDLIQNDKIPSLVQSAEGLLEQGEVDKALIEAAKAVYEAELPLRTLPPKAPEAGRSFQGRNMSKFPEGLRQLALSTAMNFDIRDLLRFRSFGILVFGNYEGDGHQVTCMRWQFPPEDGVFGVQFARDFALAIQGRMG